MGKNMKKHVTTTVPIQGAYTVSFDVGEEATFIFEYGDTFDEPLYIEYTKDEQGQLSPGMTYPVDGHPAPDLSKFTLLTPQEVAVQRSLGTLPDAIIDDDDFKVWVHK